MRTLEEHSESQVLRLHGPFEVELGREPVTFPDGGGLLRVLATGVCGTDFHHASGGLQQSMLPVVLGHEIVAEVVTPGEAWAERGLSAGDRVMLDEVIPCHSCKVCLRGATRLCPRGFRYGAITSLGGTRLWGGFAEYVALHPRSVLYPLPAALAPQDATFAVPLANGLSWLGETAALSARESVVILGPGQHGIACTAAAAVLGAGEIVLVGTGRDEARLAEGVRVGATRTIDVESQPLDETVMDLTGGVGADVIVDVSNAPAQNVDVALRSLATGGRLVVAARQRGLVDGAGFTKMFTRELSIRGVNARTPAAVGQALDLLSDPTFSRAPTTSQVTLPELAATLSSQVSHDDPGSRPVHMVVTPA